MFSEWLINFLQFLRVGRPVGKEVRDNDPTVAPGLGETDAPSDRRVILLGVGRAGIQHDEVDGPLPGFPLSGEGIAV